MPFFESFPCSSCSSFRWHLCCCFATPFASGLSKAVKNGAMDREGHTFCRESLMEDCFKVANFQPCYKYCCAKLPYIHPWSVTEPFDIIYRNTVLDRIVFFFEGDERMNSLPQPQVVVHPGTIPDKDEEIFGVEIENEMFGSSNPPKVEWLTTSDIIPNRNFVEGNSPAIFYAFLWDGFRIHSMTYWV